MTKPATQLYVGWASLAFLVGTGVILVTDQQVVSDKLFTIIGSVLLVAVSALIWTLWFTDKGDYRIVSIPYFLVMIAFGLHYIFR